MALTKTQKIWHNGKMINWDDANIHVVSHVVSYASSVFEGIRCYKTTQGPAIFRLRETHAAPAQFRSHLSHGNSFLGGGYLQLPVELVRANKMDSCYLRPIVLRGYGEVGVNPSTAPSKSIWPAGIGASIWAMKRCAKGWMFA